MFINTTTLEYNLTERAIRSRHPLSLFSTPFVPPPEYAVVFSQPRPVYDSLRYRLAEVTPIQREDGNWYQSWELQPLAEEEVQEAVQQEMARLRDEIIGCTQQRLDTFASTRIYDDVNSISKYQSITDEEIASLPTELQPQVTKFREETRYLGLATAATWAKLYVMFDEVRAGTRPMPSGYADVEAELPELVWPV